MKLIIEIYISNDPSDTDDECVKAGEIEIDSSSTIDELLDAARLLTDGQDDCETLSRIEVFRAPDGTEF